MKKTKVSLKKLFRTLSHFSYITGAALLIASLVINVLPMQNVQAQQGGSGAIWTRVVTCGPKQNDNIYDVDLDLFIAGEGFDPGIYDWAIVGQPHSGDPNTTVASGTVTVDASGAFCFPAYHIQPDDWGVYKFNVGGKNDNYSVDVATATPTDLPTNTPTNTPTDIPTNTPTNTPTDIPTNTPTNTPTDTPTATPTDEPTATPTDEPTATPTDEPTATPTSEPTGEPTATPTGEPTATPTDEPTATPTDEPTATPTDEPTATPVNTLIVITEVPTNTPEVPTNTPEAPTNTPETPEVTPTTDPGTPAPLPTLPPPAPSNPPQVLIPVTGADMSMPAPLGDMQSNFGNAGLALLGVGMVLQGLSRKMRD